MAVYGGDFSTPSWLVRVSTSSDEKKKKNKNVETRGTNGWASQRGSSKSHRFWRRSWRKLSLRHVRERKDTLISRDDVALLRRKNRRKRSQRGEACDDYCSRFAAAWSLVRFFLLSFISARKERVTAWVILRHSERISRVFLIWSTTNVLRWFFLNAWQKVLSESRLHGVRWS